MKYIIFILGFLFSGCVLNETKPTYFFSESGLNIVTFLQYHKIGQPENAGIYLIEGKWNSEIPEENYVFVNYTDYAIYLRWEGELLSIRAPGFKVLKNALSKDSKIDFATDFTEEEKVKYGYYSDRENFHNNVLIDYKIVTRKDLPKNW